MARADDRLTVIRPQRGWLDIDLGSIWRHRDLILIFAHRDVKVKYRQTVLGPLWLLVQPLALTFALTTVISGFAGVSTDNQPAPIFYITALVLWGYFSSAVTAASGIFHDNHEIFEKVYFPRLAVPLSALLSNTVGAAIQLLLVLAFVFYYQGTGRIEGATWRLLLLPFVFAQLALFGLAAGVWIAAATAKYRDIGYATPLLLQVWMFVTPIIYPFSAIPEKYRTLAAFLNPLAVIVEQGRWCFLGTFSAPPSAIVFSLLVSFVLLLTGVILFYRVERRAMDTI